MPPSEKTVLKVETLIHAPLEHIWPLWTSPNHITQWNAASDDWHTPRAENDLKINGRFTFRMEAKDGSFGFDFSGTYQDVIPYTLLAYTLDDGRRVTVLFTLSDGSTRISHWFEAENKNPLDLQQFGWQSVLNHFKKYAEAMLTTLAADPVPDTVITTICHFPYPQDVVFHAWSSPQHLPHWWGPIGYTNTFSAFDLRPGGQWTFIMHDPNGTDYPNDCRFVAVIPPSLLVWNRLSKPIFQVVTLFTALSSTSTEVMFKGCFNTVQECQAIKAFALGKNEEMMDRLEAELARMTALL